MNPKEPAPKARPLALNHRYIEAFRAVMIRGTATDAAAMLHTSQPVISKLIARFQSTSGLKLFELRKSRLVPTPEARVLFNTIERSYIGLEQIGQTIAELRGIHAGLIQIGCIPSVGMGVLPQIIRSFIERHPTVQTSLETVSSSLVRDSVASGRLDLGIVMTPVDAAGTQMESLVRLDAVCVMAPTHHLAAKRSISAKDLHGQAFISAGRGDSLRVATEAVFTANKVRPIMVAETTYSIAVCLLAMQGVGVGLVSPFVVPALAPAGLVARPFTPSIPIELALLTPLGQPTSRAADAFLKILRPALQAELAAGVGKSTRKAVAIRAPA
jgi:DNA-binding transcriptional LysR family regulator